MEEVRDKLATNEENNCEAVVKKENVTPEVAAIVENIDSDVVVKEENIDSEVVVKEEIIKSEAVVKEENVEAIPTSSIENYHDNSNRPTDITVKPKRVLPDWMVSSSSNGLSAPPSKKRKQTKQGGESPRKKLPMGDEENDVTIVSNEPDSRTDIRDTVIELSDEEEEKEDKEVMKDDYEAEYGDLGQRSAAADSNTGQADQGNTSTARDPCLYGQNCYRRNLQHRTDFSHPGDPDYSSGPTDRPECQYGTSCYRKNLQHRKDFAHTQPFVPPPQPPPQSPPQSPPPPRRRTSNVFNNVVIVYTQCPDCKKTSQKDPDDKV